MQTYLAKLSKFVAVETFVNVASRVVDEVCKDELTFYKVIGHE